MKLIFIDTETTGLPVSMKASHRDTSNWPHIMGIAWIITQDGKVVASKNYIISQREGVVCHPKALETHGITPKMQDDFGVKIEDVLNELVTDSEGVDYMIAHNVSFDRPVIGCEMHRAAIQPSPKKWFCTKESGEDILKLPATPKQRQYRPEIKYKMPTLDELYKFLFNKPVPGREENHGAAQDAQACMQCFFELLRIGQITLI